MGRRGGSVLIVRLDSMGDMLAAGPAVRAVAAGADRVTVLAGPLGESAARLLPGVDQVVPWSCPWIMAGPPPVEPADIDAVVTTIRSLAVDEAIVLTSFHQSALPTALLLRLAGVPRIVAASTDYPGALLDVRLPPAADAPEPLRMLETVAGAGYRLPRDDDGRLAVRRPLPWIDIGLGPGYLVVHPGTSAPARAYPPDKWTQAVAALVSAGWSVAVTGSRSEEPLTAGIVAGQVHGAPVVDLAGRLDLPQLAGVLDRAGAVVVANTGPAHLAAAVGTPVVSLFSPVVPALRWAPYGVDVALLGDQRAACRDTRSTVCPVPGHPCLNSVSADDICAAVRTVTAPAVPDGRLSLAAIEGVVR